MTKGTMEAVEHFDVRNFKLLYDAALTAESNANKGRALENLAEYMFLSIPGLRTIGRNIRTLAEEIDLAFSNDGEGFWRNLSDPFVVECKNRSEAVDASMIRDFGSKLQTKGLRGGFVITTAHLTKDAASEIRTALRDRRTIVAVEREHLETVATGAIPLSKVLSTCFYRCRLL
ncbi:MAG: restriction endonuclease [Bryobacterales bacterium]|nr:restriction endonuclease [Bryobacterales bacterium]